MRSSCWSSKLLGCLLQSSASRRRIVVEARSSPTQSHWMYQAVRSLQSRPEHGGVRHIRQARRGAGGSRAAAWPPRCAAPPYYPPAAPHAKLVNRSATTAPEWTLQRPMAAVQAPRPLAGTKLNALHRRDALSSCLRGPGTRGAQSRRGGRALGAQQRARPLTGRYLLSCRH